MEKDGACKIGRKTKSAVVLERLGEGTTELEVIKEKKRNWLGHWLRRN